MKGAFLALAASALLGSAAAGSLHDRRHAHQAFHLRRNTPAPAENATCSCTTYVTTFFGEASLVQETQMPEETQTTKEVQKAQAQETSTATATVQPTTTVKSTQYTTITVVPTASSAPAQPAAPVASSSSAPAAPASSSSAPAAPVASSLSVGSSSAPAAPVAPTAFVTVCPTPGTYTIPATTMTLSSETTVAAPAMATLSSSSESQTFGGVTTVVETSTTIVCPYATVSSTGSTVTSVIKTTTFVCPSSGTYTIAPTTTSVSESTVMVYPTPASFSAGTYTQPETTITITKTSDVFVCPFTSSTPIATVAAPSSSAPAAAVPASSAAQSSAAPSSAAESSSAPAAAVPASSAAASYAAPASAAPSSAAPSSAPASASAPAAPVSQASSVSVSPSSSAPKPSSSAPAIGGGNQWCMTYSPYTSSGQCKDSTAVLADIALIAGKGFSSVRIYSTDCSGLTNVGAAAKQHNIKLVLGVYISKTGISAAQAQVTEIVNWASGNWAAVEMIVIGNEAVFNKYASMSELASFISSAKSTFQSAGYTGHVTTTEPMNIIQEQGSALCAIVDVLSANIHPFFNPDTSASEAGKFVASQLKDLEKVCPGLATFNLETGWPHSGNANGQAVPGSGQQDKAIKAIMESAGGKSVFFSFVDDLWKEPGALGVEQSWGCSHLFGKEQD